MDDAGRCREVDVYPATFVAPRVILCGDAGTCRPPGAVFDRERREAGLGESFLAKRV